MRSYKITDAARAEFIQAFDYYIDHAGPEIAVHFLETFELARSRLLQFPRLGRVERGDIRSFSLKPAYPYSILYIYEDDCVYVVSFAHHARGPEYLAARLKDLS